MKFSAREDIAAPIGTVFESLSEFESFERAALRRGAEVTRTDNLGAPAPGMTWKTRFPFRGRTRHLTAELVRYDRPEVMEVRSQSTGLFGTLTIDLVQLSPRQTRMHLHLDIRPRTFGARVFLQSLRLAKSTLTRNFKMGVSKFARSIEARPGA